MPPTPLTQRRSRLGFAHALALGWLLGLALLQRCERLPGALEWGLLLAALTATLTTWRRALPLAALLLAFALGAGRAQLRIDDALPEAWEGRDVLLSGRVDSLPSATLGQGGAPGWRFAFELLDARAGPSAQDPPLALPRHMMLSAFGEPCGSAPPIRAGESWQAVARLKRPHGLMNPFAFDYELWMFEQDLRATGVLRPGTLQRLAPAPFGSLEAWRQRLRDALDRRIGDPAHAGVLAALSLGDQDAIAKTDWTLFRNTGVAHLLAVSGTHVTMFAWAAQWLVGRLWRRSARLCLVAPAPRVALWAGVAAAFVYALFSGWGVPSQRTVWMLASLALLRSLGLRWPWPLLLLASAVVVTAIDPWAISQAGFWLSFAAVGLLMASGSGAAGTGWRAALREGLRSQWVATLGLTPLSLLFFQQISVVGLAANLLAIPLVTFVVAPLSLLGALVPGAWWLAEQGVRVLMAWLRWLDALPGAVWQLPVAPLWAQASGLAGGVLLALPLPWRLRACGFALLLPLLWPAPLRPAAGTFDLLAADIGQGTAVLLRTQEHDLMFDTGPQFGPQADAGQRVLVPLARALGTMRLDRLVLSHRDIDHVGGAASVMAGLPVAELLSSLEDGHPLLRGPPHRRCEQGQRWSWDGVRFEVLWPPAAQYEDAKAKSNAMSCVLKVIDTAGRAVLLTGDIEAAQETSLVRDSAPDTLQADLLLVPHHGSKTSSTDTLLDAVAPRLALVQAGYRNRFGHPALPVLARYQQHGIRVLSSPDCGALHWQAGEWSCQRVLARRYWHAPPRADDAAQGPPMPAGEDEAAGP